MGLSLPRATDSYAVIRADSRLSGGFLVTNLVTRRQIAPFDGLRREPDFLGNSSDSLLGYLDSNQEQLNQNQPCCQLHHTPKASDRSRTEGLA